MSLGIGTDGAWQPEGPPSRHALAVRDEDGTPVPADTSAEDAPWVDGLLARVGDPVPVRVGAASWPAELLVARVLAAALAGVTDAPVEHVVIAVPDEWRDHRRAALRQCIAHDIGRLPALVGAATGLASVDDDTGDEGPVLVITAGAESFRADVCTRSAQDWQVDRSGLVEWGGADIDDALLEFVSERSPAGASGDPVVSATRSACVTAREELVRATATEVNLLGQPVRLVRADLEHLVGATVVDVVDQLVTDVLGRRDGSEPGERPGSDLSRVLLTGPLASVPMVVEAVSARVGAPVVHVTDMQAHRRYASTGVRVEGPDEDGLVDTRVDPATSAESELADGSAVHHLVRSHSRRATRGRRSAAAVAAALAAAASVAAVTMTDAGESALLSLVENTVPQGVADDARGGSLAGAVARPPLPWDEDGGDGASPRPASTRGTAQDPVAGSAPAGEGDADPTTDDTSSDDTSAKGSSTSDTTSTDGTTSDPSSSSSDGDASPREDSSAAPDPTTPTSEEVPDESSEPPTSEPDPSTSSDPPPDPEPEPDPPTSTEPDPEPEPTTTTSEPEPEPTGTSGTTSTTTDPLPEPTTP